MPGIAHKFGRNQFPKDSLSVLYSSILAWGLPGRTTVRAAKRRMVKALLKHGLEIPRSGTLIKTYQFQNDE